jgi:hypothetical protein
LERASPNLVEPFTSWRSCICKPIRHGGDEKNNSDRRSLYRTVRHNMLRPDLVWYGISPAPSRSPAPMQPSRQLCSLYIYIGLHSWDDAPFCCTDCRLQPKMATPPERSESGLDVKAVRARRVRSRTTTGEIDFQNFLAP